MKLTTKILIVEDDAELRKKYGTILKRLYQVQISEWFGSVVGLIEQYQSQIVLMDSMLPSIIRWEECRKIRETAYGGAMYHTHYRIGKLMATMKEN